MSTNNAAAIKELPLRTSCQLPTQIFQVEKQIVKERFNRLPFQFSHSLAGHPLFELSSLATLGETMARTMPEKVNYFSGNARVDQRWNMDPSKAASVSEAISHINESGTWILLKSVQKEPAYGTLLDQILVEMEALSDQPLRRQITWADVYIFIASPHSVTPFHIDHEANFLFQIHGAKMANVFDPADRSVVSEEEIERYYFGDLNAASYSDEKQAKAYVYDLKSGVGIHHPSLAGHWVKNGDDYSITLSINFCMRNIDRRGRVYQVNHYLRAAGKKPTPPGTSSVRDSVKSLLMGTLSIQARTENKFQLLRKGVTRIEAVRRRLKRA